MVGVSKGGKESKKGLIYLCFSACLRVTSPDRLRNIIFDGWHWCAGPAMPSLIATSLLIKQVFKIAFVGTFYNK